MYIIYTQKLIFSILAEGRSAAVRSLGVGAGPGARGHQLPETVPSWWTVDLSVPLLAVEAHLDPLPQEQRGPHEHVTHRTPALVVHGEVK